jgi:hypothetical protein
MARMATCPHLLALQPYLKAFDGVVGLRVVWTGLVQL